MIKWLVKLNKNLSSALEKRYPGFFGSPSYHSRQHDLITNFLESRSTPVRILEAGGIDRPLLKKSDRYTYDGLDIEYREQCNNIYDHFYVQSIEDELAEKYDLVISITLLEHVPDNRKTMNTIFTALNHNGTMVHYLPSKKHPYSILLRMLGNNLQKKMLRLFHPENNSVAGYHAFFDHCSPDEMEKLLTGIGFSNIQIEPYYRANYYFSICTPLFILVTLWENFCRKLQLRQLCSGFVVYARKEL